MNFKFHSAKDSGWFWLGCGGNLEWLLNADLETETYVLTLKAMFGPWVGWVMIDLKTRKAL